MHGYVSCIGNLTMKMQRETLMYVHLEKLWVVNIIFFVVVVAFARWNFLLFLSLKTIKNFSGQIGQPHAYVANESTLCLFWLL